MTFRTLFFSILTLALLMTSVGCDSGGNDEPTDAEIFVGNWLVVGISDDDGDATNGFAQIVNAATVNFPNQNEFTLRVDYNEVAEAGGATDVEISGTYTVNEATNTIRLNSGFGALNFDYNLISNTRATVSTAAAVFNAALQLPAERAYAGTVTLTIQKP